VRTPRGGVDGLPGGARGDRGGGDASLVLALVGEQGVPVDIAEGVQPAPTHLPIPLQCCDPAGVVDLQPGAGEQADGVQADIVGERLPAGGEQHLVGLHLAAVFQGQRDRPGPARTAYRGDGDADPHVHSGLGQAATDEFPGERLHPGHQAVGLGQQRDLGAQALPGAGHLDPDPAAADDGQPARHGM
jgi:hypothetical protein